MNKKALFMMCLFLSPVLSARPREGARFLKIGVGARELAMGSASVAVTDDVNALYWNPAGLARVSQSQITLTHAEWLLKSRYDFAAVAVPTLRGAVALGGTHVGYERQEGRDEDRNKSGEFTAADTAFSLGFSRRVSGVMNAGMAVKYLTSRIAAERASGVAFDAGAQYVLNGKKTSLGFNVRNMGAPLKYIDQKDPLPLTAGLGVGHAFFPSFLVSSEWQFDAVNRKHQITGGVEYKLSGVVSLRGGYSSALSLPSTGAQGSLERLSGFMGGVGVEILKTSIDYAFVPFGSLGETHRFSIGARF